MVLARMARKADSSKGKREVRRHGSLRMSTDAGEQVKASSEPLGSAVSPWFVEQWVAIGAHSRARVARAPERSGRSHDARTACAYHRRARHAGGRDQRPIQRVRERLRGSRKSLRHGDQRAVKHYGPRHGRRDGQLPSPDWPGLDTGHQCLGVFSTGSTTPVTATVALPNGSVIGSMYLTGYVGNNLLVGHTNPSSLTVLIGSTLSANVAPSSLASAASIFPSFITNRTNQM